MKEAHVNINHISIVGASLFTMLTSPSYALKKQGEVDHEI
jgi:hypothetical protein